MQHDVSEACVIRNVREKEEWEGGEHLSSSHLYRGQPVLYIVLGPSWWLVAQEPWGRIGGALLPGNQDSWPFYVTRYLFLTTGLCLWSIVLIMWIRNWGRGVN